MKIDLRAAYPHCDSSVLHAPGICIYCDHYPDWQQMRLNGNMNFTGEFDPNKQPDPATSHRDYKTINRWHGNIPMTLEQQEYDRQAWEDFNKSLGEEE